MKTKKDLLLIYGIGSTIDYIESNDKAKQLSDKVIDTCDAYLKSILEKENKNEK